MQASAPTLSPAASSPAERLLAWYDAHARKLPWRALPGEPRTDPYRVWLSEVMLQQTTVATVAPRFARFLERWPTVTALAAAPEAEVMAEWAGLGYYRRARNLIACAREIDARGGFPGSEAEWRALPGIGAYTAAAVAAIAFDEPAVVVDANVERVVARLYAIADPLPGASAPIRAAAAILTPVHRPGDFAQAMMDLGATVCTPRTPRCLLCPLRSDCRGFASGAPERFPIKPAKPARPVRRGRAFWIEREDAVWLVRRGPDGMLGGMRGLPDDGWNARADGRGAPPFAAKWRTCGSVRHSFTHFHLELEVMLGRTDKAVPERAGEWWPLARLGDAGLPTVFARAATLALASDKSHARSDDEP